MMGANICLAVGSLKCCKGCPHSKDHETRFIERINPGTKLKETIDACTLPCGKDADKKCVEVN